MAKATNASLEGLHELIATKLTQILLGGEFDAATLNVARQFLKDNGVSVSSADTLRELNGAVGGVTLPFPAQAANDDSPAQRKA